MSTGSLHVAVEAVALLGPGLPDWENSRPVLLGTQAYNPQPVALPAPPELSPAERRRAIMSVRLALAVGAAAVRMARRTPQELPAVFASSGADGETIDAILAVLATPNREVSPTRFHNSVHNAAAGYWGLAMQSQEATVSVCAHDASFASGLLEAAVQAVADERPVLLVAYDLPYPGPLHAMRSICGQFGVALVVAPADSDRGAARLRIRLEEAQGTGDTCTVPALDALRCGNPAARSLPLLTSLARSCRETVWLDLTHGALAIEIESC